MKERDEKIRALVSPFQGRGHDPHYLAFFACFNNQAYFEAHEVLEVIWLGNRGTKALFYQGLIQLAGAFVHVKKRRFPPAISLLKLARANLAKYAPRCDDLEVSAVLALIDEWSSRVQQVIRDEKAADLARPPAPHLSLKA